MTADPYQAAQDSAARLAELTGQPRHDVAVVLGSGWAPAADALGTAGAEVPLAALGGFPPPTVGGHSPTVRSLTVGGVRALVFLGRVHLYEGHPVATVVHGVRTAVAAGCQVIVLTNAAGGIRDGYRVGQPVLIGDHLNLTGRSPLAGSPPPDGYASRFTDLTDLYSARLRALARQADPGLAEGVYAAMPGPHYETPAEIRMLRTAGADLVGMSTVPETIVARHMGIRVLGISCVTNMAAGILNQPINHAEVMETGERVKTQFIALLRAVIPRIAADLN